MPLEEADVQQDLAKAGVYWELSSLSLSRLRFQVEQTAANLAGCLKLTKCFVITCPSCLNVQLYLLTFELGSKFLKLRVGAVVPNTVSSWCCRVFWKSSRSFIEAGAGRAVQPVFREPGKYTRSASGMRHSGATLQRKSPWRKAGFCRSITNMR